MNYTRSKELDDTGNHRTQYPVGPQDGNFTRTYTANQIDRGLGQFNQTNAFNLTWIYAFPIGRGQAFFATNRIARSDRRRLAALRHLQIPRRLPSANH